MFRQTRRSRHSAERLKLPDKSERLSAMDPAAFAALVEQCAPTPDLVRPLTAIVRQASSFEPLLITVQARKPVPIQASDRDEAIQLATEAIATGQPVRTGLSQLDAEETKQAGLTATTTFDACKHIAGLGRLFEVRLQAANANGLGRDQAIASVVASFATKPPGATPEPRTRPMAPREVDISTGNTPPINTPVPSVRERPNWDVYRSGVGTSAFVYER
ncbi:type IV secretion protein (plasmid) [Bradyrhizobium sp. Pa8]|uniref:type IV secretion protein n=1 Tax=Bradyrhizobium sp. Pa8 TaxID=3386552 RepID=UPI00403F6B1A